MTLIEQVTNLCGLRLDEEFDLIIPSSSQNCEKLLGLFRITLNGLEKYGYGDWNKCTDNYLDEMLLGKLSIERHLLTLKERVYIKNVIEPIKGEAVFIRKVQDDIKSDSRYEQVQVWVRYKDSAYSDFIELYKFPKGTEFKFIHLYFDYDIEKLELDL